MPSKQKNLNTEQVIVIADQLLASNQKQQALQLLVEAYNHSPQHEALSLKLARLLQRHGQHKNAIAILSKTYKLGSKNFELVYLLAALLHIERDFMQCEAILKKAIKINPDSSEAYNLLGINYVEQNNFLSAVPAYQSSIKLKPFSADAYNNLAWAYRAMGNKHEAIVNFEKAFEIDPTATEALSGLLMLKTFSDKTKEFDQVETCLNKASLNYKQETELNFALGKAYEDIKDYKKSFQHYKTANSLWRTNLNYNIQTDIDLFSSLKKLFTANYVKQNQLGKHTHSSEIQPIFILGMPRSSTTLIEQILSSHSKVIGGGELPYLEELILRNDKTLSWSETKSDEQIIELAENYLKRLHNHAAKDTNNKTRFITDKLPQNFRFIGAILCLFPNAKIIHCKRDPMDTCLSLYKHHFPMANHHYSYKQKELGQYYSLYEDLMHYWHTIDEERILDIQYENVLEDLEKNVSDILSFCGLEFETTCIEFQHNQRIVRTASSEQVRKGLYKDASGRWKVYEKNLSELKANLPSYS